MNHLTSLLAVVLLALPGSAPARSAEPVPAAAELAPHERLEREADSASEAQAVDAVDFVVASRAGVAQPEATRADRSTPVGWMLLELWFGGSVLLVGLWAAAGALLGRPSV